MCEVLIWNELFTFAVQCLQSVMYPTLELRIHWRTWMQRCVHALASFACNLATLTHYVQHFHCRLFTFHYSLFFTLALLIKTSNLGSSGGWIILRCMYVSIRCACVHWCGFAQWRHAPRPEFSRLLSSAYFLLSPGKFCFSSAFVFRGLLFGIRHRPR